MSATHGDVTARDASAPTLGSHPGVLSPAAYLACSWCWCIGMFLPVYLARDFGAWSFLAFAIPNVLGAAAVAFWFPSTTLVRDFARRHIDALRAFAIATILFHVVFLTGFMPTGTMWIDLAVGSVTIATALVVGLAPRPRVTAIAVLVWIASLACALAANLTAPAGETFSIPPTAGAFPFPALLLAAPALFLGFLLCPILDSTFISTREFHAGATPRIFLLAFGVLFPALILCTLGYACRLIRHDSISPYTYLHLAIQSGFTIGVQWWALRWIWTIRREARADPDAPTPDPALRTAGLIVLGIVGMAFGAAMFAQNLGTNVPGGGTPKRLAYDVMLALYGLVFPAYLAACEAPRWIGRRPSAWTLLGVLAVTSPLYWMGSILHRYWAIPIAVGVVLVAPVLTPRGPAKTGEIA